MNFKSLPPEVKYIWKVALVVQGAMGLTLGLCFFIWSPLLYERLVQLTNANLAITITTLIFAIEGLSCVLLEVPTGAIGDAIGRKWTVVWSFVFRTLFFIFPIFIPFVNSVTAIVSLAVFAVISFSIGYTLFSGSFTAWCIDHLRERAPNIGYEHLLSRATTCRLLCTMVGGVASVVLYLAHLPYLPFVIGAFLCSLVVAFCLGEMEDERTIHYLDKSQISIRVVVSRMGEIIGTGLQMFKKSTILLALVAIFAAYLFTYNIIGYLWPLYLRSNVSLHQQPLVWIGLIVVTLFSGALGSFLLSAWTKNWHKKNQTRTHNTLLRRFLIGACLLSSVPVLALSWLTNAGMDTLTLFLVCILPLALAYGIVIPCYETLLNNYIPEENAPERATIMSFGSLLQCLMVLLFAVPSGGSSGEKTTIGWAIPAAILLVVTLVANRVLKKKQKVTPAEMEE